jgi:hypothetical protein
VAFAVGPAEPAFPKAVVALGLSRHQLLGREAGHFFVCHLRARFYIMNIDRPAAEAVMLFGARVDFPT